MKFPCLFLIIYFLLPFPGNESVAQTGDRCRLAGAYRINVAESDRLYTAVEDAVSAVPFGDQQRFFFDLSVRLTPPDMLALDCRGNQVTVASSRAPKLTFVADGKTRNERSSGGGNIRSRIELKDDSLSFKSEGKAEDRVNVIFDSIESGRRLRVTRSIYAEQLTRPVVIRTVYDKLSEHVQWDAYDRGMLASKQRGTKRENSGDGNRQMPPKNRETDIDADALNAALDEWIAATNDRDIDRQMSFYMPELEAFYLARKSPLSMVRREKLAVFSTADTIDIRAEEPEIVFQDKGDTAVMRFRKEYNIRNKRQRRSGVVIQELRWRNSNGKWKIVSERDIRVIR